ncbi:MAG: sigma 54-interacting transcriptional regulator, partial [Myxococcota bacterium]
MDELTDKTLEPDEHGAELLQYARQHQHTPKPLVRVLFHPDLSRIGALLDPELLADGQWVTIGRLGPEFMAHTLDGPTGPLEDRYISRQQLRMRWLPDAHVFEIEPTGRRPLAVLDLAPGYPEPYSRIVEDVTQIEPGTLLTIGSRVMLGVDFAPWHAPDEDRMGMVGETPPLWQLRMKLRQLAQFVKPALILGPTGAGKELVARAIHELSNRSEGPFVPLNCAALPEHLTESLLFGHKKGAFTGASSSRDGAFVDSDGGSLFLDEIGELPMPIQAKLLRVLQEKRVAAVGASRTTPVNVRLIAATHRDLQGAM